MDRLPDIHFGDLEPEDAPLPAVADEDDDTDEQLEKTPQDVVDLLGFDPVIADEEDDG